MHYGHAWCPLDQPSNDLSLTNTLCGILYVGNPQVITNWGLGQDRERVQGTRLVRVNSSGEEDERRMRGLGEAVLERERYCCFMPGHALKTKDLFHATMDECTYMHSEKMDACHDKYGKIHTLPSSLAAEALALRQWPGSHQSHPNPSESFLKLSKQFLNKKAALHKAQTTTMAVFTILYWKAVLSVLRGYMSN